MALILVLKVLSQSCTPSIKDYMEFPANWANVFDVNPTTLPWVLFYPNDFENCCDPTKV